VKEAPFRLGGPNAPRRERRAARFGSNSSRTKGRIVGKHRPRERSNRNSHDWLKSVDPVAGHGPQKPFLPRVRAGRPLQEQQSRRLLGGARRANLVKRVWTWRPRRPWVRRVHAAEPTGFEVCRVCRKSAGLVAPLVPVPGISKEPELGKLPRSVSGSDAKFRGPKGPPNRINLDAKLHRKNAIAPRKIPSGHQQAPSVPMRYGRFLAC
jgi:hypothetical protein